MAHTPNRMVGVGRSLTSTNEYHISAAPPVARRLPTQELTRVCRETGARQDLNVRDQLSPRVNCARIVPLNVLFTSTWSAQSLRWSKSWRRSRPWRDQSSPPSSPSPLSSPCPRPARGLHFWKIRPPPMAGGEGVKGVKRKYVKH
jgi:hypothetical protein